MAILAIWMHESGRLAHKTVVATVMSNLGFHRAMEAAGIEVITTDVGDRYVLAAMRAGGYNLGGEQSGHVIVGDYATTGDGILTALMVMARMKATGKSLAELASPVAVLPQVLVNIDGVDKSSFAGCEPVVDAVAAARAELGEAGRILIRPSGTEPLIRVMVEASTSPIANRVADQLAEVIRTELGS